jgi:hypothetical protein
MAKLPFLLFRSLRLSHNSTCLCIEKCVRQSDDGVSDPKFSMIVSGQNPSQGERFQQSRHRSQAQELDLKFIPTKK